MKKVFRYSKLYCLVLLLIGYIGFIFVKGLLYEAFPTENYAYSLVLVVLVILFKACKAKIVNIQKAEKIEN